MPNDADRPARRLDDPVHLLERAVAMVERRRRYRLALTLTGLALLATAAALGISLLSGG